MTENTAQTAPKWFLIVAILALVWNFMGVAAYIAHAYMSPGALAALPEAERALYESIPAWATAAFAIAVFGGALGSLFLVVKKDWALPVLVLSLAGILVQQFHSFILINSIEVYGPGGMIMPAMVLLIAIYLVWLAKSAKAKGWIS